MQQDAVYKHFVDDVKQQQHVTFDNNLKLTLDEIENKYAEEAEKSPPIPKSKISREKKKNRQDEKSLMSPVKSKPTTKNQPATTPPQVQYTPLPNKQPGQNILDGLISGGMK
jgi:hypothetical protein